MKTAQPNPVGRLTLAVLSLCLVIFTYGLFADRLAPYTPQAVVQAYVVGIAPEVAGRVIEVLPGRTFPAIVDNIGWGVGQAT